MLHPEQVNGSARRGQGQAAPQSPRSSPRRTPIVRNWAGGPLIPRVDADPQNHIVQSDAGHTSSAMHSSSTHSKNRKRNRTVSEMYYGNSVEVTPYTQTGTTEEGPPAKSSRHTQQSRHIPAWIWYILAKSLGIKVHFLDKPIFGTFMHIVTLTCAFMFAITNTWYKVYDIMSEYTKETVLAGCVSIVIGLYWSCIGVYSNLLAGRLFRNARFHDSVRLHSKTIFKISAAGIMIALSTAVIIMNIVGARNLFDNQSCERVSLNVLVCKFMYISRSCHSVLALIWNLMVGVVLLSVCRTHTIGIRRFIRELEEDGRHYELYQRNTNSGSDLEVIDPSEEFDRDSILWQDLDDEEHAGHPNEAMEREVPERDVMSPVSEEEAVFQGPQPYMRSQAPPLDTPTRRRQSAPAGQVTQIPGDPRLPPIPISRQTQLVADLDAVELAEPISHEKSQQGHREGRDLTPKIIIEDENKEVKATEEEEVPLVQEEDPHLTNDPPSVGSRSQAGSPNFSTRADYCTSPRRGTLMSDDSGSSISRESGPHILSNDDILLSYWKISCRLRSTSIALQRWLMAIIMLILLWSTTYIIYWVRHEATLLGIGEFVIPILILPIICSAYGEVNYEGRRMLKCICPTTHRSGMLFYLTQNPLEMNVFGSPINYSTIGTALTALGIAFASRLILDEMKM